MSSGESATSAPSTLNLPNALTILRVLLVPVFAVLLWQDTTGSRIAAAAVFTLAALTDRWDGQIARKRGLITNFGKIADSIADKLLVLTAMVLLSALGLLPWWVTIVMAAREGAVTLLRFLIISRHVMPASRGGKLKAALQMAAIWILVLPWIGLLGDRIGGWVTTGGVVIMYLAVAVALVTAADYVLKAWAVVRSADVRE